MDNIFTRCVDLIALAGQNGISCRTCIERVVDQPRPALVRWLFRNCKKREPAFFQVSGDDFDTAVVVASKALRERALGYSSLEHAPLQPKAWAVFEAIGRAGKDGVLQSELAKELKLNPVMLHHYLGSLLQLKLVVRRRIVLSAKRKKGQPAYSRLPGGKTAHVTQTCVIALARYAASIGSCTATAGTGEQTTDKVDNNDPIIHNLELEERTQVIIQLLNEAPGGIMPERDLKLRVITNPGNRTRHRTFRTIRDKIVKAGLIKRVTRPCVDSVGDPRGDMPCLQLVGIDEVGEDHVVKVAADCDGDGKSDEEQEDDLNLDKQEGNGEIMENHENDDTPGMLLEVDIAEQVYRAFDKSQGRGLSCPEIVSILDGNSGCTGIEYKRMRSLLNVMENTFGLKTVQHFSASACHKRFVLKEHHKYEGNEWPPDSKKKHDNCEVGQSSKSKHTGRGRTVIGNLTALGSRRRGLLESLLEKEKVLLVEKIGRIISESEGNSGYVDVKVSRKIIKTMIDDGLCRYMSVAKPKFGSASKDRGTMQLLVSADVPANGKEIRDFLSRFVKRSMSSPDGRGFIPNTRRVRKWRKRKSVVQQGRDDDKIEEVAPKRKRTRRNESGESNELNNSTGDVVVTHTVPQTGSDINGVQILKDLPRNDGVLIKNPGRGPQNLRSVRLNKLRIQDHGFITARMRRAQLLHEYLVRFVMDSEFISSDVMVTQSTMEIAGGTSNLGTFEYDEVLRLMSVGLFANLFGLPTCDRKLSEEEKKILMKDAPDEIRSELSGRLPLEQTRILFKILWELGLVYSETDAKWFLRGAGVFRDFGRGLPRGASAHSIIFNSYKAVNVFWSELESVSNPFAVVATYQRNRQSAILFSKEILGLKDSVNYPNSDEGQLEGPDLSPVYMPTSWTPARRGNVGTLVEDELTMEMVLQKIVVGWEDDGKMPKNTSSWEFGTLPWLPVAVLYDNRVLLDNGYRRRRKRLLQLCDVEYFVQYARKRTVHEVSKKVLLLANKPNNNISDYNWLRRSDTHVTEQSRKRRVRSKLLRVEKKRRNDLDFTLDAPGPIREEKTTALLNFDDCVHLLTVFSQLNGLVGHWKERNVELPREEGNQFVWGLLTRALSRPEDDYRRKLEEVLDNEFVHRNAKAVENCIIHELRPGNISVEGDGQLDQVPKKLVDSFGKELGLNEVFCAILNESSLIFDKKRPNEKAISLSKRKSILRRLRLYMTGLSASAEVPNPLVEAKLSQRKCRSRLLLKEDKDKSLRFGIIKVVGDDPKWIAPNSTSKNDHSVSKRILLSHLLISILLESDKKFDPRLALLVLSRFPEELVTNVRNRLYEEKRISLRSNTRRPFEIQWPIKRPDMMLSREGHHMARSALEEIKFRSDSDNNSFGNTMIDRITSLENEMNSQTTLLAMAEKILFPEQGCLVEIIPRFHHGELRAKVEIKHSQEKPGEASNGLLANNCETRKDVITGLRSKHQDSDTSSSTMNFEINDDDRIRVESEWVTEVNIRRLREQSTLAYYKSQKNPLFGDVFGWIMESGGKGLTSHEICKKCEERDYSNEDIVETMGELVKEGVIHRFAFSSIEQQTGRASAIYMVTSHAWIFAVAPIAKSDSESFGLDWGQARPFSPWITCNGLYNTELIESVQVNILTVVAKNPGIDEKNLVASICMREPLLSERSILDVIVALFRTRRISRKVYERRCGECTIFGNRTTSLVQENRITAYPDGLELTNSENKFTFSYSFNNEAFAKLATGTQLEQIV